LREKEGGGRGGEEEINENVIMESWLVVVGSMGGRDGLSALMADE